MLLPFKPDSLRHAGLAAALFIAFTAIARAETLQPSVERAAREHLLTLAERAGLSEVQVRASAIPRSGTNAQCAQRVTVEPLDTRSIARMRFTAACGSNATPAEFIARGSMTAQVVVATADIAANRPIAASQLTRERRDVANIDSVVSDIDAVAGQSSRRAVRAGQVVSTRWLAQPLLVKRGARVSIVARNAGVEVTVAGEALQAGHRDELVQVRNLGNGKVITARVVDENTVEPAASE